MNQQPHHQQPPQRRHSASAGGLQHRILQNAPHCSLRPRGQRRPSSWGDAQAKRTTSEGRAHPTSPGRPAPGPLQRRIRRCRRRLRLLSRPLPDAPAAQPAAPTSSTPFAHSSTAWWMSCGNTPRTHGTAAQDHPRCWSARRAVLFGCVGHGRRPTPSSVFPSGHGRRPKLAFLSPALRVSLRLSVRVALSWISNLLGPRRKVLLPTDLPATFKLDSDPPPAGPATKQSTSTISQVGRPLQPTMTMHHYNKSGQQPLRLQESIDYDRGETRCTITTNHCHTHVQ